MGISEDITQRKQAEEALRESEERFRQLAENIPEVFWLTRYDLQEVIYVSPGYEKIWGRSVADLYESPDHWLKAIHPADLQRIQESFNKNVLLGEYDEEYRIVRPDGSLRYIHDRGFPIRNEQGEIYRIAGIAADITMHKQSEKALQASESHYRTLVEHAPFCIHELDCEGRFLCVNPAGLNMVNLKREQQLIGRSYLDGVALEDRGRIKDLLSGAYQGKSSEFEFNMKGEGPAKIIASNFIPIKNPEGVTLKVMGISQDITERKQAEARIIRARDFSLTLLVKFPALVWRAGLDGKCNYFNQTWLLFTGRSLEEELGDGWTDGVHPEDLDRCVRTYLRAFETRQGFETEYRLRRYDGEYRWIVDVGYPFNDLEGEFAGYIGSCYDITAHMQAEGELEQQRKFLRHVIDIIPNFVFAKDRAGRFTLVNQAVAKVYGTTVDELLGKSDADFNSNPEELEFFRQKDIMVLDSGKDLFIPEEIITDATGNSRWFQTVKRPLIGEDGKVDAVLGVATDITSRKRAEEALRNSEQAIRELYDITSLQHRSFDDRIRSLLDLGCRRFALPHGMLTRQFDDRLELAFLQSSDEGFVEGTLLLQCQTFCAEALKSDAPLSFEHAGQSEWRHQTAYAALGLEAYLGTRVVVGQTVYGTLCFASSTPYHNVFTEADKDFLQIMARWIGGELERKQAEETLQESEIRYRALFDDNPSMYFTVASDGTVMAVNQFGAKQLGYSVEELVGKSVFRVFHNDDKLLAQQHFNACLQNPKQLTHWEIRKVRKDGSYLYVKENARMVQDRSGDPVVLIVCEDITERKQTGKDLKQAYDQLREFTSELKEIEEKERTQFSRELHDEFGQSLTALKLDLAWVARRLLTMPSCDSRKAIQDKINDMSSLVAQTAQAVRRMAASMRPSVLDDLGLVAALEWQAQQCQSHSGIRCEVVVDSQIASKEFPESQSTTMFRIAQELTTNVMRHSQASDMRISLNEEGKCLVLSVKDNGIGVAQSSIDHPKSFGILGIRERASLVGGECTIVGRHGEGTTATVRVPLALST